MNDLSWKFVFRALLLQILLLILIISSCDKNSTQSQPKVGVLVLEVQGLQSHLSADITIIGPNNYSQHFTGSDTVSGLTLGDYSILASAIVDTLGDTIAVNPDSQLVTIKEGKTTTADVFYQSISLGSLQITASGLPAGEKYDIVITSVDDPSLSWHITQSALIDSLKPGPYRIEADEIVITGGETYKPDVLVQIFNVVRGAFSQLSIVFRPKYGKLSVLIIGLPSGSLGDADVEVYGYGNAYYTLHQSGMIDSLEAGDYTVIANEVTLPSGMVYTPVPDSQVITVVGGEIAFANIDYRAKFGLLILDINGLPEETDPDVIVDGPSLSGGIQYYESQWIDSLEGGDYSIIAKSVTATNGTVYVPDLDSQVVKVLAGDTSYAIVEYKENIGALSVLIIGLPSNTNADVGVTGPNNYSKLFVETVLLDSLEPGNYSIMAQDVTSGNGEVYEPHPDSQLIVVAAGDTAMSMIDYKLSQGAMKILVSGLPDNVPADIAIENDDLSYTAHTTKTIILDSLNEGIYRIMPKDVTDLVRNEEYYDVLDTLTRRVTAGDTITVNIIYKPGLRYEVFVSHSPGQIKCSNYSICCENYSPSSCVEERNTIDYYDSTTMSGYIIHDCDSIVKKNITDSGYTVSLSHTGMFGSSSLSQQLTSSRLTRTLDIASSAQATATIPSCAYYGDASFKAKILGAGYTDSVSGRYPPTGSIVIDVRNPRNDTVKFTFDWAANGTAAYDNATSWGAVTLQVEDAFNPCVFHYTYGTILRNIMSFSFGRLANSEDHGGSDSGTDELVFTRSRILLSLKFNNMIEATSHLRNASSPSDFQGESSASLTSELSVTVEQIRSSK